MGWGARQGLWEGWGVGGEQGDGEAGLLCVGGAGEAERLGEGRGP